MKKKIAFLLVLVVLFIVFLALREVIFSKEGNTGRIKILSSPGAGVFIDSTAVGKTPFEQKLKEGEYTIKLIPEGIGAEAVSWQGKVRVNKDTLTYVNRELGSSDVSSAGETFTVSKMEKNPKNGNFGEVYIDTEPAGAIVYLDNDEKGVSPLLLEDVQKGDHEISVFLPGFFRRTQKINVDSSYRTNTSFNLAVDQTKKDINQLRQEKEAERKAAAEEASKSAEVREGSLTQILIQNTPTGFLRVREEPSTDAAEVARIKPGGKYEMIEEADGWFKIKVDDKEGWVSSDYAVKE
jgi:uncharacterized protein YgiM (DUF1202 family)